jgi:hypothetical protein
MRATFFITALWLCVTTFAADLRPLFNGKDLSGWVNVNCHPKTFTVRDGMIVSTGKPTGVMRTEKQYENFIVELEYRHMFEGGNAGLFVWADPLTSVGVPFTRAIEVQILDGRNTEDYTSHGDLFAIHGATFKPDRPHPHGWMRCLPSERRAKPPGEWNHYRVVCTNGIIQLAVNGKGVSGGSEAKPRKGYICLESEGSECHFRNMRIQELPSTSPSVEETAPLAEPFVALYNGLDLTGWTADPHSSEFDRYEAKDWTLAHYSNSTRLDDGIWTTNSFEDFVFTCDWRIVSTNREAGRKLPPPGSLGTGRIGDDRLVDVGEVAFGFRRGSPTSVETIVRSDATWTVRMKGDLKDKDHAALELRIRSDKAVGNWNRMHVALKKSSVEVKLNGKIIYEQPLVNVAPGKEHVFGERGPIGILNRPGNIEFANIYVRELK